jgi:hypothetical protein
MALAESSTERGQPLRTMYEAERPKQLNDVVLARFGQSLRRWIAHAQTEKDRLHEIRPRAVQQQLCN